ncbi:polysaccharide pyruvyl transferase family protein [Vibrio cholerae]|uniref:polysaccharide pyruvyl transferase family protein n=1 Tax=Vibrio cholerae TaxID=666 RepID=UPI00115A96E8|nr:polysaccharide pyruvyl transferase family protein [Vibrio cholerae]TQQ42017.1 radical SAM protein [Vibrio cholerae]
MNFKSIYQHINYSFRHRGNCLEKPKVIQFPVIDICNSRCQMCRIWENKKSNDITVEDLRKGLSSDLFDQVEAIGFNGGEPTLRDDLVLLVETVLDKLPNLKQVSLISNAYKHRDVVEQIAKIGALIKSHGKHFDVMISLDGYGEVHDRVRGRTGNFENAKKVLSYLNKAKEVDNVRIGCTVIRENVFHLADLFEFCLKNNLYIKYRLGVPHQRLYTENLLDPYALTFEEKYEFVEFLEGLIKYYEPNPMQNFFYRSLIDQIINDKDRVAGCDWQHRGATITAKGELAYCAVKSKALMQNIADGDPKQAYFGNQNHLKDIISKECAKCNHDYVGVPNPSDYRRILFNRIEYRLGIKDKLRKLPGFSVISEKRKEKHYRNLLNYYRDQKVETLPSKKGSKEIMICGWYGTETLGDKGIIGGVMHVLRKQFGDDIQFTLVSLYPYISQMTKRQMPEFRNTRIVNPEQGVRLACEMDYVVFGGGPLMAIDSLAPMQAIFEKAKQGKAKTVVSGCGVGPLGDDWHNESIASILKLSDIRIYRDQRSRDHAKQIGVDTTDDAVAEDPAFTWLASIGEQLSSNIETDTDKNQTLLLGLRDFPYQEYARHIPEEQALAIRDNYEKVVVEALEILVAKRPGLTIRPLPMCTNHFGSDDRWFYRRLFRSNSTLEPCLDYSLLGREREPVFYCESFKNADALLAMRFHSLVFGLGLGVSSVGLDYTLGKGKVRSLAERYNAPLLGMVDLKVNDLVLALEKSLDSQKPNPINMEQLSFAPLLLQKLDELKS